MSHHLHIKFTVWRLKCVTSACWELGFDSSSDWKFFFHFTDKELYFNDQHFVSYEAWLNIIAKKNRNPLDEQKKKKFFTIFERIF